MTQVAEREPISLCHHPHRNILVTVAGDGAAKIWKA